MTDVKDIVAALEQAWVIFGDKQEDFWEWADKERPEYDELFDQYEFDTFLGRVKVVEEFGADHGKETGYVFSLGGKFYRIATYYNSWDSNDWSEAVPVEVQKTERQVTLTEWTAV